MFISVFLNTVTMWFYPLVKNNEAYLTFLHRFSVAALILMVASVFLENLFKGE
jgi:hypothetical protein